jgi:Ca2+-binding RTX toxin-like protein
MGELRADDLRGRPGNDVVRAGAAQASLRGTLGNDVVRGGLREHTLFAGQEDDTLCCGAETHCLYGKAEANLVTGGNSADLCVFRNALDEKVNVNTIVGFRTGVDKMVLDALALGSLASLAKDAVAAGNFVAEAGAVAQDADDFILYDTTTHILSCDANGSGAGIAQQVAVLANGASLSATDLSIG